jgi:hypothetical protein
VKYGKIRRAAPLMDPEEFRRSFPGMNLREASQKFKGQAQNARRRGIEWKFDFSGWCKTWADSGKWSERGQGHGYAMCRKGDVGPYAPENVYIATAVQNTLDARAFAAHRREQMSPSLPLILCTAT